MRASLRQELIYLKGLPSTSSAKISSETYEEVFSDTQKSGHLYSLLKAWRSGLGCLPRRSIASRWRKDRKSVDRYTHTVVSEESRRELLPTKRKAMNAISLSLRSVAMHVRDHKGEPELAGV